MKRVSAFPVVPTTLLILVFAQTALRGVRADDPVRPNIVYIISDDQTYTDFGFIGNERVHTPNLDALARQSARFLNGYVPASVCRPSLVTLLTGLYPHQHGVHFNHGPPGNSGYNRMTSRGEYEKARSPEFELIKKVPTLPGILHRELGYRSLQTGKFWEGHWRNGGFTEGMTTFTPPPPEQTYGGIRKLANGETAAHGNGDWGLQIGRETMKPITDFISDCEKEKTPCLVWYAPYLPHQPHDSPKKFYELAKKKPKVAEHEVPYFASIAQFDDTVGQLIQFVEEKGIAENTIFVFVVDNGWSPSRKREKKRPEEFAHTKESKRAPFDYGLRTPILVRWDGKVTPATRTELVNSIDIVPTLLNAAGVKSDDTKQKMPGLDLLSDSISKDRAIFGDVYPGDATSLGHPERDIAYRWVRRGEYKLIVPHGEKPWGGYLKAPALFNVVTDPDESQNLIDNPNFAAVAADLRSTLDSWWDGS